MTSAVKSTELRKSYAAIAKRVRGGKNVTVITKRGRPDLALIDLDYLEDLLESQDKEFQASLRKALQEKTHSLDAIFSDLG
ncbi:MAG: type II toxin-antitoxin system prevent-host-death family antitoxin [bacterium]|nr:type II toxin-antitoxin system prevent-host-death family antitoxin [bacterium]MDZ4248024.1 type II toxin-antitoxin system prevent-host-death family antitoxin [Patescibacteria group bacterium]